MSIAIDEAVRVFDQAKSMLTAQAMQVPMSTPEGSRTYVALAGASYTAYGLYNLAYEIKDLSKELAEVKRMQELKQQQSQPKR